MRRGPRGLALIGKQWSLSTYRYLVLLLTFVAYACYHASRKPTSIVKSVLDPEPVRIRQPHYPWPVGNLFIRESEFGGELRRRRKGWAPFDQKDGTAKLGEIDVAFLACYSMGMYVAGHLGDTLDLRRFLTIGMMGSGIFVGLFGMGYFWNIHVFGFYLLMPMIAGLFQATGWPSVVAVIGNWFGKTKRGLIMGVWNAHTSVGNISGSLLAASVLQYGWGWSFILPGVLIFIGGVMVWLFLPAYPEDVGLPCPNGWNSPGRAEVGSKDVEAQIQKVGAVETEASGSQKTGPPRKGSAVGILEACSIPGVIPFALCLFFSKLVAYTFLYWLPFYLSQIGNDGSFLHACCLASTARSWFLCNYGFSIFVGVTGFAARKHNIMIPFWYNCAAIGGEFVSVKSAGNLSTLFDVGGIFGGILAGYISDKLNARATTAACFMYLAIPALLLYRTYGSISHSTNIALMMLAGLFVNGPYALITTAVSADLGTHSSLKGNSRALATVTAIIDGTGSVGAALGPLLTGFISRRGWNAVFAMLIFGALVAGLLLSHLVMIEIREMFNRRLSCCSQQQAIRGSAAEPLLREEGQ
ncbi:hypothetical protein ACLOJK_030496 [Asimina triloba]